MRKGHVRPLRDAQLLGPIAMPVRIEVARHVARVVVMLAGYLLLTRLVPMSMRIEVARDMAGVVVVLAGNLFLPRHVAMAVRVQIARHVPGVVVVLTRLFLRHLSLPF